MGTNISDRMLKLYIYIKKDSYKKLEIEINFRESLHYKLKKKKNQPTTMVVQNGHLYNSSLKR